MKTVWKIIKIVFVIAVLLFLAIQLKRPARTNPLIDQAQTIQTRTQMTPQVAAILDRSCRDCHSNNTEWPWYSNVAPVSWWLTDHVHTGRKDLNLSEWGKLDRDRQSKKLQQMCDEVADGQMPLSSYLPMHPQAKLSDEDKKAICAWTEAERARMANSSK